MKQIKWHIGKEAVNGTRLDKPPYRAFFVWLDGDTVIRYDDFSESELLSEISRMESDAVDTEIFRKALDALIRS